MKLSLALIVAVFADNGEVADDVCRSNGQDVPCDAVVAPNPRSGANRPSDEERAERRYVDLEDMAVKLWAKNGFKGKKNGFDERKYWAYGCHCFLLGDRPMSELGKGAPVDALDNKCKAYKDCNKCVRQKHGDGCIGEMVKYTWKWSGKQNGLVGKNAAGSCERELFECDKAFVEDSFAAKESFTEDHHAFWSKTGFDSNDDQFCKTGGTAPIDHECCGGHDRKFQWIGLNQHKCCKDGQSGNVKTSDESC